MNDWIDTLIIIGGFVLAVVCCIATMWAVGPFAG